MSLQCSFKQWVCHLSMFLIDLAYKRETFWIYYVYMKILLNQHNKRKPHASINRTEPQTKIVCTCICIISTHSDEPHIAECTYQICWTNWFLKAAHKEWRSDNSMEKWKTAAMVRHHSVASHNMLWINFGYFRFY